MLQRLSRAFYISTLLFYATVAVSNTAVASSNIVYDAEYYILEAQNGKNGQLKITS